GRAEEALRRVEGDGVDTTGQRSAARGYRQVIGTGEAGDRVEQDGHVSAAFNEPLRALEHHLGNLGMVLDWLVEGRGDDLTIDRALHVGDLFGSLTDQADHQVDVAVIGGDAVGDRLQQHRLTGLRRRDDQATLAATNRGNEVNQAGRNNVALCLKVDSLVREDRRQVVKAG